MDKHFSHVETNTGFFLFLNDAEISKASTFFLFLLLLDFIFAS
jgi:hypothetical protein